MFEDVTVIGAGRAGSAIAARLRERGIAVRDDAELRLLCVPDRAIAENAQRDRAGTVGRARFGRHTARRARPARAPLLGAPAADAHPGARPGAARRGVGRRHRRDARGARARRSGWPRCSACDRSCSPTTAGRSTTRARRWRRTSSSRCTAPRPGSSTRPARRRRPCPLDGADDRERLRADRPDRPRRLGDRRTPPRGDWSGTGLEPLYAALAEATRP